MLEPPPLAAAQIAATLAAAFDLHTARLDFLPVGNDATAWAFRVTDDAGVSWFLKVRRGRIAPAGLTVPRLLSDRGIAGVVAPVPARPGTLAAPVPGTDFALVLYPFVRGAQGMETGLTHGQWRMLGRTLRRIHDVAALASLPADIPREAFRPPWRDTVRRVDELLAAGAPDDADPVIAAFAALWQARRDEILAVVTRADELGAHLRAQDPALVLCHADIHTANVLVDDAGALHIVDWDGALLAPRARDLMFMVGGEVDPARMAATTRAFLDGYGAVEIHPAALAYYRYEWVVQELGDYGARLLLTPDLGPAGRAQALAEFEQLFAPGDVVDEAYASANNLSALDGQHG